MLRCLGATLVAAGLLLVLGDDPAQAQGCPRGERPLPETRLCPSEAIDAFLSKSLVKKAELYPGCNYWVNETNIAGDVLLYGALRCGNWIAKLNYVPGNPARLTSRLKDGSQDVEITFLEADASNPLRTIHRFARSFINDEARRRECIAQDNPNVPGAIIFDLSPKVVARIRPDGPSSGECGPYGASNGPNHWRAFGGHVWYFGITDSEHSFDPAHMILLQRDTQGGGLKGWRVKY